MDGTGLYGVSISSTQGMHDASIELGYFPAQLVNFSKWDDMSLRQFDGSTLCQTMALQKEKF